MSAVLLDREMGTGTQSAGSFSGASTVIDRIVSLLGQGFPPAQVAAAVGVTPAYVSQVLDISEHREKVAVRRAAVLEESAALDVKLNSLEQKALKLIEDKMFFVRSPLEAARIFSTLNSAKRRTQQGDPTQDVAAITQVNIVLPRAASVHIQLNNNNQVIEVEGQTMAPLPSRALPALAASIKESAVIDIKEKLKQQDSVRANKLLNDLTVVIDGVERVL